MLLPKGIEPILSQKVGEQITLCQSGDSSCDYKYRAIPRSYLTKLPGFLMTGFKQLARVNLIGLISYPAYAQMMSDFNQTYPSVSSSWNSTFYDQGYSYNVPKKFLYVKYAKGISESRR